MTDCFALGDEAETTEEWYGIPVGSIGVITEVLPHGYSLRFKDDRDADFGWYFKRGELKCPGQEEPPEFAVGDRVRVTSQHRWVDRKIGFVIRTGGLGLYPYDVVVPYSENRVNIYPAAPEELELVEG